MGVVRKGGRGRGKEDKKDGASLDLDINAAEKRKRAILAGDHMCGCARVHLCLPKSKKTTHPTMEGCGPSAPLRHLTLWSLVWPMAVSRHCLPWYEEQALVHNPGV